MTDMLTEAVSIFQKGGPVMYPLLLCSIFCVAIAIERILYYRQCETRAAFPTELQELLARGDYAAAEAASEKESGDSARVTAYYLTHRKNGLTVVETQANAFLEAYEDNLVYLKMIVTVSPLLGLLGTILGMIRSFKVFDLRAGQPFAITSGIGEALIATAFGLAVAIFAMVFYGILTHRAGVLRKQLVRCCQIIEFCESQGESPCV